MSYTREQAEEMILDWNKFNGLDNKLYPSDKQFLDHKFPQKVSGWYKCKVHSKWLAKYDFEKNISFGFNLEGKWFDVNNTTSFHERTDIPATDEEVLQRLTEEAKRLYPEGSSVRSLLSGVVHKIDEQKGRLIGDYFLFNDISVLDLTTGEWTEVVKQPDPKLELIKKLEDQIKELKSML
jgi:hypothetical protein